MSVAAQLPTDGTAFTASAHPSLLFATWLMFATVRPHHITSSSLFTLLVVSLPVLHSVEVRGFEIHGKGW